MDSKTIIVGGGMAGISAALRLKEQKKDFIMITDTLGGRVCYSSKNKVSFGAVFFINNYRNAKKLLKKEKWLNTFDALFVDDEKNAFQTLSLTTLLLLPQILKFIFVLLRFSFHYKRFKKNCEHMTHIEALKKDKYLTKLSNKSSSEFIAEKKMEKVAEALIYKFSYACTFTPVEYQSAFDLLTPCQGFIIPMFKFSFDKASIAEKLSKELVNDKVISIEKKNEKYEVRTEQGKVYITENVIVATPANVTQKLLGLDRIRKYSQGYVYHLKGEILDKYSTHSMNTFSSKFEVVGITKEYNNTYLVFSKEKNPDLTKYFKRWEILSQKEWDVAVFVYDNYLLNQNYNESITIAGDHNSCGMEPAAISGIYAANRVLKNAYGIKIRKDNNFIKKMCIGLAIAAVVFILAYLPVISPFLCSRGSVDGEMTMTLPGDELLPSNPRINMTQAVTVNATPDKIWPWLVQMGQDKAGFYSFEKLERLFGFGIHNTYRIVPEWQNLKSGDFVRFHKNGIGMMVHSVDPGKSLVLISDSRTPFAEVPGQRVMFKAPLWKDKFTAFNWSFNLIPLPDGKTRFVVRSIAEYAEPGDSNIVLDWFMHFGSEITGCIMNWQLINEVKQCAESEQDNIKIHL